MNTDAIPNPLFIPLSSPCPYDLVCSSTVYKVLIIIYLSAVYTKSPTLLSRKPTAPLQSFSPEKRLQMSDGGAGEHWQVRLISENSGWNQLHPLKKWGHHLSHQVFLWLWAAAPAPWGFSRGLFGNTAFTPWRRGGLSTGAPLHLLLSSRRKILSCSAPCRVDTLRFMSDRRAALPCLWDAAWIRRRWNSCMEASDRDWPLLQCQIWQVLSGSPRSDPRCALSQREMFPGTGGNGTCPRSAPDPCPSERADSADHQIRTALQRGLVGCVRRKLHSQMYLHFTGLVLWLLYFPLAEPGMSVFPALWVCVSSF